MGKLKNTSGNGTWFPDVHFEATANEMKAIAENNNCEYWDNYGAISDKSQFDFNFETEEGVVFTVYDWKEYRHYDLDEILFWHIGGYTKADTRTGLKELEEHLKDVRRDQAHASRT